jgi:capsular polysaccharide biosynthesis protein
MKKQVTVPLPLNISASELHLFKPYCTYEIDEQEVSSHINTFVTFSGFCVDAKGLIKGCYHDHPHQFNSYIGEVAEHYHDVCVNPENLVRLDDDRVYLAFYHPWFNYYHWLAESIFRLWIARDLIQQTVVLLPEYYGKAEFIMESLEPFRIKEILFIPNGKSLMVKHLLLPHIKPVCDSYNKAHLHQVRDFYIDYVFAQKKMAPGNIERLYVSRRHAGRRQVIDEEKLMPILQKYGFTIYYPEKHSFLEQVAIFAGVRYLVGMQGSGLTNMLFMPKGGSLLEYHKDNTNELDHPSPLFWYMAEALEINYYHQSCLTRSDDYYTGDYLVDPEEFDRNIRLMLSRECLRLH